MSGSRDEVRDEVVVGRDIELGRLRDAYASLSAGRGEAVLVEGEPWIGKSALVDVVVAGARADGVEVLWAGLGLDEGNARDERNGRDGRNEGDQGKRGGGRGDEGGNYDRLLDRVGGSSAAGVGAAMGIGAGAGSGVSGVSGVSRAHVAPVLVVFEGLHEADDGLLSLWRRISRVVDGVPVLLVGTRRLVPQRSSVDRLRREVADGGGLVLALSGLASAGVAALAARLTQATPGPDLLGYLAAAGGNPRYIRELISAASLSGALQVADGVAELKESAAQATLSGSATIAITDRLDFVRAETLAALRGAALLEAEFSVADLALITASTAVRLVPVVDEAMAAGLIEPAGNLLRFRHPVVRQSLRELTPPERRTALYLRAAQVLIGSGGQPERVARQLLAGAEAGAAIEAWETDWLAEHGETLMRREPAMAVQLLERAVAGVGEMSGVGGGVAGSGARREVFEDLLADAEFRLFRFERAARIAAGNAARSSDPERIGRNTWLLGYSLLRLRRLDDLLRALDEAAARPGATALWRTRYSALRSIAFASFGRMDEARVAAEAALASGESSGDATAIGYALHALSVVAAEADQDSTAALELIDRALTFARSEQGLVDLRVMLWTHRFAIGVEVGDAIAALMDWARQMLVSVEATGTARLGRLRLHVAEVAYELGLWDEAEAGLELIADHELSGPAKRYALLAQIAARRDAGERAFRQFEAMRRAEDVVAGGSVGNTGYFVLAARALRYERGGAWREAVDALSVCLDRAENRNPLRYRLLPWLTRLALAVGDRETAEAAALAAGRDARLPSVVRVQAGELWCRGLVDGDPAAVVRAADLLRGVGLRSVLGNALEDAAELLARAGEPEMAREKLLEAMAVYDELGASWDARRAASRLRAHGVRVRARAVGRRATSGPESLTPTERRVAELVAEGRSNPDIAERLSLSRRTVESHVSRILAKLRITSRQEVRARLSPTDA